MLLELLSQQLFLLREWSAHSGGRTTAGANVASECTSDLASGDVTIGAYCHSLLSESKTYLVSFVAEAGSLSGGVASEVLLGFEGVAVAECPAAAAAACCSPTAEDPPLLSRFVDLARLGLQQQRALRFTVSEDATQG